jgi:cobalt/nickel transport system permease protein
VHIPDGFIDAPMSIAAAVIAAPVVVVATRRSGRRLIDRDVPIAGLVTAYLIVSQLLVFPVAFGTSAHLIGAVFALLLVGPDVAITCITIVLVLQALLFGDGGISALGLNAINGGIVPVLAGWLVLVAILQPVADRRRALPVASAAAAFVGVMAGAAVFCLEYVLGATETIPTAGLVGATLGANLVIGAIEGTITGLLVAALLRVRPDLLARWYREADLGPRSVAEPDVVADDRPDRSGSREAS